MEKTKKIFKKNFSIKKISWKKNIFYGVGLASLVAIPVTTILINTLNSSFITDNSQRLDKNLFATVDNQDASSFSSDVKPLVPIEYNTFMRLISTPWGPIGFWKNEIRALDWFGAIRWTLDTTSFAPVGHTKYVNRSFINWSYDFAKNEIWLLTNSKANIKQKFICISADDGLVRSSIDLNRTPATNGELVYFIQVLSNGNVIAYGNGGNWDRKFDILDVSKNIVATKTSNVSNAILNTLAGDSTTGSRINIVNIIPITTNYNILVFQRYIGRDSNMNAGFILVDDDQNMIFTDPSNPWSNLVNLYDAPKTPANRLFVNPAYYKLLDGRVLTTAFDQVIVFDANNISTGKNFYNKIDVGNIITSFSFDSSENLYFTALNNSNIFKLIPPKVSDSSLLISTYYDLNGSSNNEIRNNSQNFVLYNVYNYSGQIMLIKPYKLLNPGEGNGIPFLGWPSEDEVNLNLYGLSAAITNNETNSNFGDTKGLLNTDKAFQFSADFTIDSSVLNTKLPSEITSNDLTLLNQGFFTNNVSKNPNGTLKYPPFTKTNINDEKKTFTVEVHLDQIPWFAKTLPLNSIPLKIARNFDTVNGIDSRISWKDAKTDYDFINTLPTKVDTTDLKRFDPFLIDLSSQVVVDGNGSQLYPKKEYTTTTKDDTTGQVTIECTYSYMPLGVAIETKNALSYSFSKTFNIFKSSDPKVFNWNTDGAGNSTTSTISNIPSLKKLTEANVLPSSIKANDQNQLLEFINRNTSTGYPISKMRATITPNDNTGTLSIVITLPASYYGTEETFTHLYTGLNRLNNYTFNYSLPTGLTNLSTSLPTTENTSASLNYTKVLPSSVGEEQIFADFVRYGGYNSLDLVTTLVPNDSSGTLTVQFELKNNYPSSVATINTFSLVNGKTISTITIGNFLTTSEFQSQYVVNFKNNNDLSLNAIKNMEVHTIVTKLNEATGLTVEGKTYHSKEELVELFIASKGVSIPTIAASNVSMYTDNESGLLTFELLFPASETGLNYPLSFTQTFSGFIQGVAVPTSDIFIFKNQNALDANLLAKLPSAIANELKVNPTLIKDYFVQTLAGEFVSLINNQANFTIKTFANDLTGTLGISIEFKNVTNSQTLKLYSKSYVGFSTV